MDFRSQLQASLGDAYQLDRELGGGGMSQVFVATEKSLGRQVVVKVLPAEMAGQLSVERFKREIALAARLQHPHIVPLLTAGETNGLPYFTMPLVEGESLRARLARQGELPLSEAVRLLREIASALAYAHDHGIVHRDIKPDNVLLSGGSAMITDFGVAKALSASSNGDAGSMTSMGVALGTPAYMSPEQASADPAVDHRADIYSFGVLAYELLTGQPPFVGRTPQNLLAAHVTETPEHVTRRRSAVPPALAALVMRCLEKRAADRPQTAGELVHALDQINTPSGGSTPTSAQLPYPLESRGAGATRTGALGGSRKVLTVAAVLVIVGLAGWGAMRLVRGNKGASRSIAVMPFDIGNDTAYAYLADGLSEELTTKLSKIPGLTVRAYSSSRSLQGKTTRDVGNLLDVGNVLTATVRRAGDRLRVNTTLVNAADASVVWSDSFDESDKDQFALQDKIAGAIAGALRLTLTPAIRAAVANGRTVDPEVHDLVQRSRFLTTQRSEQSYRAAVVTAEAAVAKDSTYADAWAALANALGFLTDDVEPPVKTLPQMRRAARKAVELDPTLAESHAQLGTLYSEYEWDVPKAEQEFRAALALDSTNASAIFGYTMTLRLSGKGDSATALVLIANHVSPAEAAIVAHDWFWSTNAFLRISADSGIALCKRIALLSPMNGINCTARRLHQTGKQSEANAAVRELRPQLAADPGWADYARIAAYNADTADAREALVHVLAQARTRYMREDFFALTYCLIGDRDEAVRWWKRAYEARSSMVLGAWVSCPSLQSDPRFRAAIGGVNVR
jgi:serine/threonine-protein kinase